MQHRVFKILGFSALLVIFVFASIYNCLIIINAGFDYRIVIKSCPITTLILLVFSYMCVYRVTIYSSIILMSLHLCLFGDIFIGLYDPSASYIAKNEMTYFIVGGSCFFIARMLFGLAFVIKPYKKFSVIIHPWKKLLLSHLICVIPFTILGILNILRMVSFVNIAIFVYVFFGFGFQLSYAYLRINSDLEESKWSSIFGFIGMFLFNISDILLFISMYTDWVPIYVMPISDNIYWAAIYLISISVVRSPYEQIEMGKHYIPISTSIICSGDEIEEF